MKFKQFLLKNRKVFIIWSIAGIAASIVAMLYYQPWGDGLGVARSPQRETLKIIFDFWVMKLPISLLGMSIVAGNEKWLAPRGRYQEGKEYPIFSTYAYAAIAFTSALFAAAGILSYDFFDLCAGAAAIAVTFFNPILGWFTLYFGGLVRSLVFGLGNPVIKLLWPSDGATWIWLGIFYWWFREKTKWGKNPVFLILYWIVVYVVWRTVFMFDILVWTIPVPALWATLGWFFTNFLPSGLTASVAALLTVEALIKAVGKGGRAPVVEE